MRQFGNCTTAATTEVEVGATAYTEQAAGGQRSLVSSSASDAAAGTGARKVKVTYFTMDANGVIAGPLSEIITLNGVTAVAMVETLLFAVEKIEVVSVGSGGVPAGTISMKAAADGTGATIASVATGKLRTFLAHHYVAPGKRCKIDHLVLWGGDAAAASFQVRAQSFPKANVPEVPLAGPFGVSNAGMQRVPMDGSSYVAGPAKITAYVAPANNNSQVSYAEIVGDDL